MEVVEEAVDVLQIRRVVRRVERAGGVEEHARTVGEGVRERRQGEGGDGQDEQRSRTWWHLPSLASEARR